jgi:hypothetical protein
MSQKLPRLIAGAAILLAAFGLSACAPPPVAYVTPSGDVVTTAANTYPYAYGHAYDDDLYWGSYYWGLGISYDGNDNDNDNDYDLSDAERDQIRANFEVRQADRGERREARRPASSRPDVRPPNHNPRPSRPAGGNRPSRGDRRN